MGNQIGIDWQYGISLPDAAGFRLGYDGNPLETAVQKIQLQRCIGTVERHQRDQVRFIMVRNNCL